VIYKKDVNYEVGEILRKVNDKEITFIEEAEDYFRLVTENGLTQQELANLLGRSQSAVANKIRLLKLPPLVRKIIDDYGLTERHARAILRLHDEQLQLKILRQVCDRNIKVNETEEMITKTIKRFGDNVNNKNKSSEKNEIKSVYNNVKAFASVIKENVTELKEAGVKIKAAQFDKNEYFEFVIQIPKKENGISRT